MISTPDGLAGAPSSLPWQPDPPPVFSRFGLTGGGSERRRPPRARLAGLALVAAVAGVAHPAHAGPTAYFAGGHNRLFRVDLAAGEATEIGPLALDGVYVTALAFGPDGTLYGLDSAAGGRLLAIDTDSGAASVAVGLALTEPHHSFGKMTFDACGGIWASGLIGPIPGLRESIVSIDPVSGEVNEVLVLGRHNDGLGGLAAFGETLYAIHDGALAIVDPLRGEFTPIGGGPAPYMVDMDFAADGFLWGATFPPPIPIPVPTTGRIYRLDPQSGEAVHVRNNPWAAYGLAIGPPPGSCGAPPLVVPALSPRGLFMLAAGLAVAGGALLARRRTAHLVDRGSR